MTGSHAAAWPPAVDLKFNIIRRAEVKDFRNKVRRKIFRAKREEITGEWRKLHKAELHVLYFSPNIA